MKKLYEGKTKDVYGLDNGNRIDKQRHADVLRQEDQ